jgi:AraC-like DNA-binding protein
MIEIMNGTKEIVKYRSNSTVRMHDNVVTEDYPLHWHTPLEIIMPIDNSYTVCCNNVEYTLQEGEILIINSGVLHKLSAPTWGRRYIILADLSPLYSMHEFESLISILPQAVHITPSNAAKIFEPLQRLIYKIIEEYKSDAIYREKMIYSRLISILVLICRNRTTENMVYENKSSIQLKYSKIILSIYDYINNHFNENITLDQVADLAGFSKYHFSRIFRQYADTSFYQYLNNRRILQATKLLMGTDMSIMEVSMQCGFSSISSFIRMFKIHKGCTPSEFKEMHLPKKQIL